MIKFVVIGKPFGQKRPRAYRKGRFIGVYSPKENVDYANNVRNSFLEVSPIVIKPKDEQVNLLFSPNTPIGVKVIAYFVKPKISKKELATNPEKYVFPLKKPDLDNIAKAILDALNGIAWHDDSQVVELIVEKCYSFTERVEVELWSKKAS
jgi:Holliday junction resolvase RusA-like endonuclease